MEVIKVRNVHRALPEVLHRLDVQGVERDSRNGPVIMFPTPVSIVYERPRERVMFWSQRDANPFFHFAEAMWMLAGRNDVEFLTRYVPRMAEYSDNGEIFHGAYGNRWRYTFEVDQLDTAILELQNSESRRAVIQMWDARSDLPVNAPHTRKDIPCNLVLTLQRCVHSDKLDMVVFNRSNDLIWGALGANAVHFSFLQELIAGALGIEVGTYTQVTANLHAYKNTLEKVNSLADEVRSYSGRISCPYVTNSSIKLYPKLFNATDHAEWCAWLNDLENALNNFTDFLTTSKRNKYFPFFDDVMRPILLAHHEFKTLVGKPKYLKPQKTLQECKAPDWRIACTEWIQRRYRKYLEKETNAY